MRYLNELILINDRDKSDLHEVGESSGEKSGWSLSAGAQQYKGEPSVDSSMNRSDNSS